MKTRILSAFIALFIIYCFALSVSITRAQNPEKSSLTPVVLTPKTVTGTWQLNSAESDDVPGKIAQMIQNNNVSDSNNKTLKNTQDELPAVSISLLPPEKLMLTGDENETAMTINEGYNDVTLSRKFAVDGQTHELEYRPGMNISVRAFQKQNNLIVETISPRGNKLTESFMVTPDGKKLNVTLRIINPDSREIIALHRVYNRSMPDIFSDEASGDRY